MHFVFNYSIEIVHYLKLHFICNRKCLHTNNANNLPNAWPPFCYCKLKNKIVANKNTIKIALFTSIIYCANNCSFMHCHFMVYVRIVLTTLVTITCLLGDNCVELTQHPLLKALADNATHAAIGALSGIAFAVQFSERTTNIFGWFIIMLCFVVSSFIDLDHFVEARSWHLEDATNLSRRPFLHCSSIVFVLLIFYVSTTCLNLFKLSLVLGVLLCAFVTHHIRDAVRHGFWICPFGHTQRLPHLPYIILTILTPYLLAHLHSICRSHAVQQFLAKYIHLNDAQRASSAAYRYLNV